MKMIRLFCLLVILSALFLVACDGDDNGDSVLHDTDFVDASDFPYSCHFVDTFNKDLMHCVGYKTATSLEQAAEWCDENALGCAIKMKGTAQEGGCESVADVSSGYCLMGKETCAFTWGSMGDRTTEEDCDEKHQYSSAWGCVVQAKGDYVCTVE